MPSGVYPRTERQLEVAKINLAKGHEQEARKKAHEKLRALGKSEAWRQKVSQATKEAMHSPHIRNTHLSGLQKARKKHGVNFAGGNGHPLTPIIQSFQSFYSPLGFIREYCVKTKNHGTQHKPPTSYKIDFAHPGKMIAIEIDGPSHMTMSQREKDKKKTEVLESLGWQVIRITHK